MQSVTPKFLAQTTSSSKVSIVADLYASGALVSANLPVVSADITMDLGSDIIRSAQIRMANPDPTTGSGGSSIDYLRSEVNLKVGYVYSTGQTELVSMGRFMIWDAGIDFSDGDVVDLELYDRSKYLGMSDIIRPIDFSGQTSQSALQQLVTGGMPSPGTVTFASGLQNPVISGGGSYDTNYLDAIRQIADGMGGYFSFDVAGLPVVQVKPTLSPRPLASSAVYGFNTGTNGNIVTLSRSVTREGVYNGVGVYGGQPDDITPQPFAEVFDTSPTSKTYWDGSFGHAFKRIENPHILTSAECLTAAKAELAASISYVQPLDFQVLPNPALVPGDVITVTYPDNIGTEVHIVESINFNVDSMSMNITTAGRGN